MQPMRVTKYSLVAIALGLMLIFSEILVQIKQHPAFKVQKPDLESMIKLHPDGWKALAVPVVDPHSLVDSYDIVVSQNYENVDGKVVTVLMTWSRDGVHRPGHPQEVCYNASGLTVTLPREVSIQAAGNKLDVIAFSGRYKDMVQDVVYWGVTGGKHDARLIANNVLTLRVRALTLRFRDVADLVMGDIPDNLMVRVSSWRRESDPPSTAHIDYIKDYLQSVSPSTRRFLTGVGDY